MENYLGLGLNSSSFLNPELLTPELLSYFKQEEKPESQANVPQKSAWERKFSPKKSAGGFSIEDVKLGSEYEGYVKLTYNYWMFVTVKGVEWLLHKKQIKAPDWVDWKKYYNIGDKILVKALEFKDINGEKRVLWTQL